MKTYTTKGKTDTTYRQPLSAHHIPGSVPSASHTVYYLFSTSHHEVKIRTLRMQN